MKLIQVKLSKHSGHWRNKNLVESIYFYLITDYIPNGKFSDGFYIKIYDPLCIYRKDQFTILVDDYEVIDANPGQNDQQGPDQTHHE